MNPPISIPANRCADCGAVFTTEADYVQHVREYPFHHIQRVVVSNSGLTA